MDRVELRGFLKGFGVALVVSAAIFYMMIIGIRMSHQAEIKKLQVEQPTVIEEITGQ